MKKLIFPITVFIIVQLLLSASMTLWIIWYVFRKSQIDSLLEMAKQNYSNVDMPHVSYGTMVGGILILSFVIIGTTLMFIEWIKSRLLYRQRSDFMSTFTHELLTPLTCIKMNLETLLNGKELEAEKKTKLLRAAFYESNRLQHAINKIIEISRIEHRKHFLSKQLVNVNEYFGEWRDRIQREYPDISLTVRLETPDSMFFRIDMKYFGSIFDNLLENSIKYASGPLQVTLKLWEERGRLCISFTDNGVGIEKKDFRKIFKIFYRGNSGKPGTGLGLYLTRVMVKRHKGKLWLESQGKGQGATFTIRMPVVV